MDFKGKAKAFWRAYGFLASILPYTNAEVSFVKRVVTFGVPILIGAGYYLDWGSTGKGLRKGELDPRQKANYVEDVPAVRDSLRRTGSI